MESFSFINYSLMLIFSEVESMNQYREECARNDFEGGGCSYSGWDIIQLGHFCSRHTTPSTRLPPFFIYVIN